MKPAILAVMLLSCALAARSEEAEAPKMEPYPLVLLVRGPNADTIPPEEAQRIQSEHLAHLKKMWEEGHLVIAGPFGDQEDPAKRGMCLYKVASIDEARKLASDDPAVKAGRLKVEAMTWWVEKGYMEFPKTPPATTAPSPR